MSEIVLSPITNKKANYLFSIDKQIVIEKYKAELKIDPSRFFTLIDKLNLYECVDTGYRFFYPFALAGDGAFYEPIGLFKWYYVAWKWDYEVAKKYICNSDCVLDIGCGEGYFLDYLKTEKECTTFGLELNEKAKMQAESKGHKVDVEFIENYATKHSHSKDVVTFFQVLEHIGPIDSFLKSAIDCVKVGGKIILAVPNNNPYILTYNKIHTLNIPPHHMGWWNEKSLTALEKFYPIKLLSIEKQPLEHYDIYTNGFLNHRFPNSKLLRKVLFTPLKLYFYLRKNKIDGASIMAVYEKK